MMTATTSFRSSTVAARSWRATNRDNAHWRHTGTVKSSSCAECGFYSGPLCFRTRLATQAHCTQRYPSHPLSRAVVAPSSPTFELQLSDRQRAIRHVTRLALVWLQLRHAVPRSISAKRPSPSSAISHPPGSPRFGLSHSVVSTTSYSPSQSPLWLTCVYLAVETAFSRTSGVSQSRQGHHHDNASLSVMVFRRQVAPCCCPTRPPSMRIVQVARLHCCLRS